MVLEQSNATHDKEKGYCVVFVSVLNVDVVNGMLWYVLLYNDCVVRIYDSARFSLALDKTYT